MTPEITLFETLNLLLWMGISALAIDNLADILTAVNLLDRPRLWFQLAFPRLQKIAVCAYCQSWWFSIPVSMFLVSCPELQWARIVVVALALHRMTQALTEFFDRYKGRAPLSVYATVVQPKDKDGQEATK